MKKALQKKYALSEQGAKDLCKGILYSVPLYIGVGVVILVVIFIMHYLQYTITYMRRVSAAELHLQKSFVPCRFVSFRNMIFRI